MGHHWGTLVRRFRDRAGLTQDQLSGLAGLSARSIRAIERGEVAAPRQDTLQRLRGALSLTPPEVEALRSMLTDKASPVSVGILGPLTIARRGIAVAAASPRQQRILGLLAVESDRVVAVDEIAELLWVQQPPSSWRNRIQVQVAELREMLAGDGSVGRDILVGVRDGYRLHLPSDDLDATQFRSLLDEAEAGRLRGDHGTARDLYEQALLLWRGSVLAGLDDRLAARPAAQALHRARIGAVIAFADLLVSTGQGARAVPWLAELIALEPLHEPLYARYMRALAACGEHESAVHAYQSLRTRLGELGVSPQEQTQAAYHSIVHTGATARADAPIPTPAQLPLAPPVFGGRDDTVDLLLSHLRRSTVTGELAAPRIVLVHGMPGVGKTALALRAGHALRTTYPDGQLYADLRGESATATAATIVLGWFLRALGVPAKQLPDTVEQRSDLLRTRLAGRRMLMLLDDAAATDQVLPLLPSVPGTDVLITSRTTLVGLPMARLPLTPLAMDASRRVLEMYLPDGVPAGARIAAYCGGLPLALQIAAGRIATGDSPAELADAIQSSADRLDQLRAGQLALPPSLRSAYDRLSPLARTALRRLALLPMRTLPAWAADVVCDTDAAQALRELTHAHLLTAVGSYYRFHDLVRLFGAQTAEDDDRDHADQALFHLAHTAAAAVVGQTTRALKIGPLDIPQVRQGILPVADADTWFEAEYANILDAVHDCARQGRTRLAAALLSSVALYLRMHHLPDEMRPAIEAVMAASEDCDPLAYAYACESMVQFYILKNDDFLAIPFAERALEIFEAAGEARCRALLQYHLQYLVRRTAGRSEGTEFLLMEIITDLPRHQDRGLVAAAHQALGIIRREYHNDQDAAIDHFETALEFLPDKTTRDYAQILNSLGVACTKAGRREEAARHLTAALRLARSFGDKSGIVSILQQLSEVVDEPLATDCLDEAEALVREVGQPYLLTYILYGRSRLAERGGDLETAVRILEEALHNARLTAAHIPKIADSLVEELEQLRTKATAA